MSKIWCRFQKWNKNWENVYRVPESCIWIGSCKFLQYGTGYLPSALSVLTNTPEISPNPRGDIFQINFPQIDGKTWYKHSHGDFATIRDTFTCRLSKRVPKRRFLQSGVTKFFTDCNFGKTLAKTIISCSKMFKIWCTFEKWNKKL